jgi:hypothetical protein
MANITVSIIISPFGLGGLIDKSIKFSLPIYIKRLIIFPDNQHWAIVLPIPSVRIIQYSRFYSEIKNHYKYCLNHEYNFVASNLAAKNLIVKQIKAQGFKEIA